MTTGMQVTGWRSRFDPKLVVRDSLLRQVYGGRASQVPELGAGVYTLETIDGSGQLATRTVPVRDGEVTEVDISDPGRTAPDEFDDLFNGDHPYGGAIRADGLHLEYEADAPGVSFEAVRPAERAYLQGDLRFSSGVKVVARGDGLELSAGPFTSYPEVATVKFGDNWEASLPIDEAARQGSSCVLRFTRHGPEFVFERRRRFITQIVAAMKANTATLIAHELDAAAAFQQKYTDPIAALVGALSLEQMGSIKRYHGWLENLARDFAWIPDTQLLLASVLIRSNSSADKHRAMDLTISASARRPMTSEGLSLGLDLMRRRSSRRNRRLELGLAHYSSLAARTRWESTWLVTELR